MFTTPLRALRFPPNSLMATTIGDDHTKRFSTVPVLYVQPVHLVGMASGGEPGLRHSLEKGETTISMQNRIRRRRKNIVLTRKKHRRGSLSGRVGLPAAIVLFFVSPFRMKSVRFKVDSVRCQQPMARKVRHQIRRRHRRPGSIEFDSARAFA